MSQRGSHLDPSPWLPYTIDLLDGEELEAFIEAQHQKGGEGMSANGPEPCCDICEARASETPLSRSGSIWLCGTHAQ